MKRDEMASMVGELAEEMLRATEGTTKEDEPLADDNSRQRVIGPELRVRFVELRSWMQRLGLVDPVLSRFDSYTVSQATSREIAERLAEVAESLR